MRPPLFSGGNAAGRRVTVLVGLASMRPPLFSGGNGYPPKYMAINELSLAFRAVADSRGPGPTNLGAKGPILKDFLSIFHCERVCAPAPVHTARVTCRAQAPRLIRHRVSNPGYVRVSPVM